MKIEIEIIQNFKMFKIFKIFKITAGGEVL